MLPRRKLRRQRWLRQAGVAEMEMEMEIERERESKASR
jgi:hypothetical protein